MLVEKLTKIIFFEISDPVIFFKKFKVKNQKSSINVFYEFYLFGQKWLFSVKIWTEKIKIFENSPGNPDYVIWLYNECLQIFIKCQNSIRYAPIRSFPLHFPWRSTLPVCTRITSGQTRNILPFKHSRYQFCHVDLQLLKFEF